MFTWAWHNTQCSGIGKCWEAGGLAESGAAGARAVKGSPREV